MFYNILKDENFAEGFKLKGLNSIKDGHSCRKIICGNGGVPDWFLCQWNSKYNLLDDGVVEKKPQGFKFYDISKAVETNLNGTVTLSLDASKEYDEPRKPDQPWPHILLEQDIEPFVKMDDISSLRVCGRFGLKEFVDYMGETAKEYHTAQFVWVVVVKNVNRKSPDFGHFIWVVMSILDSRYEVTPLYCAQDKALPDGEFIYSFSSGDYLKNKPKVGEFQSVNFDLYPKMPEILARAQKAKYLTETKFSDLAVTGMNFGFEITGTYKAVMQVEKPAILAEKR